MLKNKIDEIIKRRLNLKLEDDDKLEECWAEEIRILSNNITQTKDYYKNDCSDEVLFWTSEVFEELIEQTQSKELLNVLEYRALSVTNEMYRNDILEEINYAKFKLN
ncbi:hypothetical protein [Fenollaria timonensis]|uniref:hypothetical protein n=1 Tax=Fenollaria timonensis TaxID=1723384 RepID=UPI0026ED01A6|nr:hypothetical protein [Fenollaria timonensis]